MKKDSKNFRDSAVLDVMNLISDMGVKVIIYEPFLDNDNYFSFQVTKDLNYFIDSSDIMANRIDENINKFENKLFSRDIYNLN